MSRRYRSVRQLDYELRNGGIPVDEVRRHTNHLLAPGVTVGEYLETLRTFGKIKQLDGTLHYHRRPKG